MLGHKRIYVIPYVNVLLDLTDILCKISEHNDVEFFLGVVKTGAGKTTLLLRA